MSDELKPCKLKPCKHCGGEARFQIFDTTCNVECQQCGIGTRNELLDNYRVCACKWNRSADDAPEPPVETGEADSRERLEADLENMVRSWCDVDIGDKATRGAIMYWRAIELLDRQAAITQAECKRICDTCEWPSLAAQPDQEAYDRIAELTAERDELKKIARRVMESDSRWEYMRRDLEAMTAERDELRGKLHEKQHVCDVQRDSFLKLERENRELQDVCGELERTVENMRGVE